MSDYMAKIFGRYARFHGRIQSVLWDGQALPGERVERAREELQKLEADIETIRKECGLAK